MDPEHNFLLQIRGQKQVSLFDGEDRDGLYFPVTWPHRATNGPQVSISFSITFRTTSSDRREVLYRVNERLRRVGIRLPPVGQSDLIDGAKYRAFRTLSRAHHLLGGRRVGAVRSYQ